MPPLRGNNQTRKAGTETRSISAPSIKVNHPREPVSSESSEQIRKLNLLAEIYEKTEDWEKAAEATEALCRLDPNNVSWWIMRAVSVGRKTDGNALAIREVLFAALERFPTDSLILYNLACCSCQMGDFASAWHFLEKIYGTRDKSQIKRQVGDEPELESLWESESLSL